MGVITVLLQNWPLGSGLLEEEDKCFETNVNSPTISSDRKYGRWVQ